MAVFFIIDSNTHSTHSHLQNSIRMNHSMLRRTQERPKSGYQNVLTRLFIKAIKMSESQLHGRSRSIKGRFILKSTSDLKIVKESQRLDKFALFRQVLPGCPDDTSQRRQFESFALVRLKLRYLISKSLYYRPGQPNADSTKNVLLLKNPQF